MILKRYSRRSIITSMRRMLLRWVVVLAVAVMLCGHVTELFDHWDHTLTTGKDADYSIVLVAACAGFVFLVANYVTSLRGRSRANEYSPMLTLSPVFRTIFAETSDTGPSPPPILAIRI
jgi:uncharacterized membrane protein YbhN (UPF0104 family)